MSGSRLTTAGHASSTVKQSAVFFFAMVLLMSIVVWDMRRVREMSAIIHDDRIDLWERLNETGRQQWLSPVDLCLLNGVRDVITDVKSFRNRNCSKAAQQMQVQATSTISPLSQRHFCNIGASLGKSCPGPLHSRTFFSSRLKDSRYRDADNKHLSLALRALAKENMQLIFLGDGLSKQNQDALLCDIMRTDSVSIVSGTHSGSGTNNKDDYSYFTDYTIKWKEDKRLKLDVKYYKVLHIEEEVDEETSSFFDFDLDFDFFGMKNKHAREEERKKKRRVTMTARPTEMTTSSPYQSDAPLQGLHNSAVNASRSAHGKRPIDTLRNPVKSNGSYAAVGNTHRHNTLNPQRHATRVPQDTQQQQPKPLSVHSQRRLSNSTSTVSLNSTALVIPRFTFRQVQSVINDFIANSNRSVAIIANTGVWYNSREKFRRELPVLLQWLESLASDVSRKHKVLFRETAAQHWNHTSNGYYDREYLRTEDNNGTCVPIQDNTPELDWRNIDVYNVMENEGLHHIRMVPFHSLTMPLHNMHPTSPRTPQDCTHFCYFPQMWQPIWFALYNTTLA